MTKYSDTQHKAITQYRQGKKSIQIIYSDVEYSRIAEYCQSINTPIATWIKRIIAESLPDRPAETVKQD